MTRPYTVGQKFIERTHLEYDASGGAFTRDDALGTSKIRYVLDLVLKVEVLETDERGAPYKIRYEIESIEPSDDTEIPDSLRPGLVIVADHSSTSIRHTGIPRDVPEALQIPLKETLSAAQKMGVSEDRIYGTDKKVHLGDRWPPNFDLIRETWFADPSSKLITMEGHVELSDLTNRDGQDCLTITILLDSKNTGEGFPAGTQNGHSSTVITENAIYPTDERLNVLSREVTLFEDVQFSRDGVDVSVMRVSKIYTEVEYE